MTTSAKPNVFLDVHKSNDDYISQPIGTLRRMEIVGCSYSLNKIATVPSDSCVQELSVETVNKHKTVLTQNTNHEDITETYNKELRLTLVTQHARSCIASNAQQCMQLICCGRCKDPFVVNNIGRKFFADAYNKPR